MDAPVLSVRALGVVPRDARTPDARGPAVLDGVSFDLAAGSSVGIVGASGAGKSTLGLALLRLLPHGLLPTPGSSARLAGRELFSLGEAELRDVRGRQLAMVFQEPITALNPSMRVGDQLAEAVTVHGEKDARAALARATEMLDRVGIPDAAAAAQRYPHEFSGGMRQRLLLAMPLMLDPLLIIADEPTTALDPVRQARMLDLLDQLRRRSGTALMLITHDLDLVGERCERVLVLDGGRLVEDGASAAVLSGARSAAAQRLARHRLALPTADANAREPAPGTPTDPTRADSPRAASPLLEVRALRVRYAERRRGLRAMQAVEAVQGATLHVARGEVLGVVGESGCGKTSLAQAILRLVTCEAEALQLDGADLSRVEGEALRRLRRRIQYMPQDAGASLSPHLTCEALVAEGPVVHGLCGPDEAVARARTLLESLGLPADAASRLPRALSSGQRQRVALARALAVAPELLVCDEPVSAVDPPTRGHLLDTLARLRDERGLALLFISHDLAAVARIADRIAVMHAGRIVETGPTRTVLSAPTHTATRTMLAAVPTGLPRRSALA